ncbi:MAG TPA: MauE/DoxX family redox-associated membrane protein [Mycobacteriales bacterium]|nr:MauE/DoxX family redox-associated membrane protein [Mycobacteriales bacterium]
MEAVVGPYLAATALLAVGGAPKTWSPGDTTRALRAMRLPVTRPLVRLIGLAEVVSAAAAVALPGRTSALVVAGWYAVFAAVVALALRTRVPLGSCGCFGAAESPPSVLHLLLVVGAAAVSLAVAATGARSLLPEQTSYALVVIGLAGMAAWFGYLVMTRLAALRVAPASRP